MPMTIYQEESESYAKSAEREQRALALCTNPEEAKCIAFRARMMAGVSELFASVEGNQRIVAARGQSITTTSGRKRRPDDDFYLPPGKSSWY
jgi:hypothetical protein